MIKKVRFLKPIPIKFQPPGQKKALLPIFKEEGIPFTILFSKFIPSSEEFLENK